MKQYLIGFFVGLLLAAVVATVACTRYGMWRQKLGRLHGEKEGTITVINFLADHFPEPDGRPIEPGRQFGLKWYKINVIETNGITTLQVKNRM